MAKRIKDEPKPEYNISMTEIEKAKELIQGTPILSFERNGTAIIADENGEYQVAETVAWVKIATEFRQDMLKKLKGARLAVFLCICLHINQQNQSRPTIKTIAKETGYSTREVMRSVQELKEEKILDILKHHRKANIYEVRLYAAFGDKKSPKVIVSQKSPKTPNHVAKVTQTMSQKSPQEEPIKKNQEKEEEGANAPTPEEIEHYKSLKAKRLEGVANANATFEANHLSLEDAIRQYCGFAISHNKTNDGMLQTLREMKATPTDIEKFSRWWRQDWRGKDGSPPTLKNILEFWPAAQAWSNGNGQSNAYQKTVASKEEWDNAKPDSVDDLRREGYPDDFIKALGYTIPAGNRTRGTERPT